MTRPEGSKPDEREKDPPTRPPKVAEGRGKVRTIRRGPVFEGGKPGWTREDYMDDVRELTWRRFLAGQDLLGGYLDMQPDTTVFVDLYNARDMAVTWRGQYPVQLRWTAEQQGSDEYICVWEQGEAGDSVAVEAQRKDWSALSAGGKINLEVARKERPVVHPDNPPEPPPPPPEPKQVR